MLNRICQIELHHKVQRRTTHITYNFYKFDIKKAAVMRFVRDYSVVKCRKPVCCQYIVGKFKQNIKKEK